VVRRGYGDIERLYEDILGQSFSKTQRTQYPVSIRTRLQRQGLSRSVSSLNFILGQKEFRKGKSKYVSEREDELRAHIGLCVGVCVCAQSLCNT